MRAMCASMPWIGDAEDVDMRTDSKMIEKIDGRQYVEICIESLKLPHRTVQLYVSRHKECVKQKGKETWKWILGREQSSL